MSRSLKYDSIFFSTTDIYMDTTVDHFTPLALRVRGNKLVWSLLNTIVDGLRSVILFTYSRIARVISRSILFSCAVQPHAARTVPRTLDLIARTLKVELIIKKKSLSLYFYNTTSQRASKKSFQEGPSLLQIPAKSRGLICIRTSSVNHNKSFK